MFAIRIKLSRILSPCPGNLIPVSSVVTLSGAGTDARESLSEAERKALIPARREGERDRHEGRPHVRVPYKVSGQGDCVERWPNGALFHLNKEECRVGLRLRLRLRLRLLLLLLLLSA